MSKARREAKSKIPIQKKERVVETFWNGNRCLAQKCKLKVKDSDEIIDAVKILWLDSTLSETELFIDDTDGLGWRKVTIGKGFGWYEHKEVFGKPLEDLL